MEKKNCGEILEGIGFIKKLERNEDAK